MKEGMFQSNTLCDLKHARKIRGAKVAENSLHGDMGDIL